MSWYTKIPFLNEQEYERYLPSAFDESLTLLQKVNKVIEGLNQVITAVNYTLETVDGQNDAIQKVRDDFELLKTWLESEGLQEKVVVTLNEWFDSGKLATIINTEVFNMKLDTETFLTYQTNNDQKLDSLEGQLTQTEQDLTAQLQQKVSDVEFIAQNIFVESELDRLDKVYRPALSLEKLPSLGNGTYNWNGAPFIQDNITIYNGNRYGIYVDFGRNPIVFKQSLSGGQFETFDLRTVPALETALALPTENNNHCTWSLMVDSDGYIHIAGNMHADPLRYVVSNAPESINTWSLKTMTNSGEGQVTYPTFVKTRDGVLLFFYRSGISSNGRIQVNKYNTATKTWSKVQANLLDGTANAEGVYLNHIAVDKNNVIHIMFMWRQASGGVDNRDVGYAKSSDKGTTWTKTNGTAYVLPITHFTQETALPSIGRGLINQSGLEADENGNPHGVFIQNDSGGKTQLYHVWHDGTLWYNKPVTNFKTTYSLAGGRIDYSIARPSIFTTKSGRVYIIYRKNDEGYRGALRLIDVTPGTPSDDFKLLDIDLNDYEPTFDTQSLYEFDELHMIVGVMTADAEFSTWWNHGDNWNNQGNWILTVDLSQIDKLQNGSVVLPSIETLSTYNAITQGDIVIENTELQVMDISGLIVDKRLKNKQLFVRLKTRSNLVLDTGATGLYATLAHVNELAGGGGSTTSYGSIRNLETGTRYHYTPWIPIRGDISDVGSFITLNANVNNGQGRFTLLEIELGTLN